MATSDLRERLRRLLLLIPYAARHPGASIRDLAQLVQLSEGELIEELDFLLMVGQPPFAPDDCVDIRVEDGRVYVELDQALDKPPRLTAFEALALAAAARGMAGGDEGTVARALSKIEAALPQQLLPIYHELLSRFEVAQLPSEAGIAGLLRQAIAERREVELEYFAESRGETSHRPVRPRALRYAHGHWYLSAFCLTRNDDRLFRVDRIVEAKPSDRRFEPLPPERQGDPQESHEPGEPPPPPKDPNFTPARLCLSGGPVIRYARERFGSAAVEMEGDDQAVLTLSGPADSWTVSFALSFGGAAELLGPKAQREELHQKLKQALEPYDRPPR
jgi:proteasome accessory factor C